MKDFQKKISLARKKLIKNNLAFIPLCLVLILSVLVAIDIFEKGRHFWLSTNSTYKNTYSFKEYPFLKNKYKPEITAEAALVVDKESRTILFARNESLRFSPASTTKIMTSLVALEHYKLQDILEVKETFTEGSILGLKQGQRMTFENLLYAMMLPSANDAAIIIAQNYPGGSKNFVGKMNNKTRELNLKNTHFEDPVGLIDRNDYTTAIELSYIAQAALDNKILSKVVATYQKEVYDTFGNSYLVFNKNKLLGVEGVNGIKTGFTEEAGDVLVTSKIVNGHTIIIIVLRSQDRFADTYELLKLVNSENLTYLSIHP